MLERGRGFELELEAMTERLRGNLARIEALWPNAASDEGSREALYFTLERASWTLLEMAKTYVFELRLGIPKRETDVLDMLRVHGTLSLEQGRRFRQLSEYRNLSSRDPLRIEPTILSPSLGEDLKLFHEWLEISKTFTSRTAP